MELYGNLINRIEEGRKLNRDIQVGDDITMYHWSDRTCYYVTDVIDQKHIMVKEYHVCADRTKPGGMGHQDWVYFKTQKEMWEYLNQDKDVFNYNLDEAKESLPEEWVYRYNKWYRTYWYGKTFLDDKKEDYRKMCAEYGEPEKVEEYYNKWYEANFTEKERKKLSEGKAVPHYHPLESKISFGKRDYYYDWEF